MNRKLAAQDSLCLRVATALVASGLPEVGHLLLEARNDGIDMFLLTENRSLFRYLEAFVVAPKVDQERNEARRQVAKEQIGEIVLRGAPEAVKQIEADTKRIVPNRTIKSGSVERLKQMTR